MAYVTRPSRDRAGATTGRPSIYTEALAAEILERLACGESLRAICQDDGMPHRTTVIRWLSQREDFRARYAIAREIQADVWRDEIHDLARSEPARDARTGRYDPAAVAHLRNQVGTLRWLAVKLLPKGRRGIGS